MTRLKQVVVVVAVSLLIPSLGQAKSEYENIRTARSVLEPVTSSKLPGSTDPSEKEVIAALDELEKKLELTPVEAKWIKIVREKQAKLDKVKTESTLPELFARQQAEEKKAKREAFAAAFPILQQSTPPAINVARLRSSNDSCPANFATPLQGAQGLMTELITQISAKRKTFSTASKEEQAQDIASFAALGDRLKQNVRDQRKKDKEKLLAGSEKRSFKDSIPQIKAGIEGFKDLSDELDSETDRRSFALIDEITKKLAPAALAENKDQEELQNLVTQLQARLEPVRQQTFAQANQAAIDLHDACTEMREEVLEANSKSPIPLTETIKQIAMSNANPKNPQSVQEAQLFVSSVDSAASDMKCPRVAEEAISTALGEPMKQKITSLAGVPDALTLIQTVANLLPQMSQLIGDAEQPLNRAINACVQVAEQKKAFESMLSQGQNAAAGPAQARLSSQRQQNLGGANSQASAAGGAFPTHQPLR